ncbi:MAG: hypothetical protein IPM55_21650 [Acidobacteria bacterium]|nr:hypothetical protein [Acidobacteriota bacterium]
MVAIPGAVPGGIRVVNCCGATKNSGASRSATHTVADIDRRAGQGSRQRQCIVHDDARCQICTKSSDDGFVGKASGRCSWRRETVATDRAVAPLALPVSATPRLDRFEASAAMVSVPDWRLRSLA